MKEESINVNNRISPLSRRIIQLQEIGFVYDFQHADKKIICVQTNSELELCAVKIISLECFMAPGEERRYLYSLESENGLRGLLLNDSRCLDQSYL